MGTTPRESHPTELQSGPYPDGYRVEIIEQPRVDETRG